MRRCAVLLLLLGLTLSASVVDAVDLKAGWYADIVGGAIYYDDRAFEPSPLSFTVPLGSYGPFTVTQNHYPLVGLRAGVLVNAPDVIPGTYIFKLQDLKDTTHAYRIRGEYETDYNANRMRIELVKTDVNGNPLQVLWSQNQSGHQLGIFDTGCSIDPAQWVAASVTVIPEPSALAGLLCALVGVAGNRRMEAGRV